MEQRTEGSFEAEGMSPSAVLEPWIAFVEQATSLAEVQALRHAVEAVCAEMQAVEFDYAHAMWCLEHQWQGTAHEVLQWQRRFTRDVQQAIWHWEQVAMWLPAYGEQHKESVYAVLYEHARTQQQRVAERCEALWGRVVELCQERDLAVPAGEISSPTGVNHG